MENIEKYKELYKNNLYSHNFNWPFDLIKKFFYEI